ncbi:ogr/Delta-like zinc finger family protein [Endozoicomonas acroporae]|uniref:ogr/Delta-like zinc finger family protein n=1 Tax=Endozoicomonas acroporae TaxID=1701104 RepID=UPI000C766F32|nr:ogr/Delta-like zinc finger family protein [Endozoicomonas acroporae]
MKITCPHCGEKSSISSSKKITQSLRELYCHCDNPLCDARFVMSLAHKHDTTPPRPVMEQAIIELVRRLSPREKRQLMDIIKQP